MDRKIRGDGGVVTLWCSDSASLPVTIILGIDGKSSNPDRHAITLSPAKARELARLLNAVADLSQE